MLDQKTTFQEANQRHKEGPKPGLYAGLDIGGTKTAVLLVDGAQTVVGRGAAPTVTSSPSDLVDNIYDAVVETLAQCNKTVADLLAVGAGVPGMVDPQSGEVRLAVNLNLQAYPLGSALSDRFGAPVALENDVRAASLGAYGWLSINFLLNRLDGMSAASEGTMGTIEMGGASSQVTVQLKGKVPYACLHLLAYPLLACGAGTVFLGCQQSH